MSREYARRMSWITRKDKMNDKDLINHVAEEWIRNGGDADGFAITWTRILERIREREEAK
jgi:hypothetical protein